MLSACVVMWLPPHYNTIGTTETRIYGFRRPLQIRQCSDRLQTRQTSNDPGQPSPSVPVSGQKQVIASGVTPQWSTEILQRRSLLPTRHAVARWRVNALPYGHNTKSRITVHVTGTVGSVVCDISAVVRLAGWGPGVTISLLSLRKDLAGRRQREARRHLLVTGT